MAVTITYAKITDALALEALFRDVVAPLELYSLAARADQLAEYTAMEFARLMEADARSIVLATIEGAPAGFAIVTDEHGPIKLEWYGVHPSAREQGVGEALLRFVLSGARQRSSTRVWCDTRTDNLASNALLKRLGFRQLCVLPNHWYGQDYFLWDLSPL
jgi:ribosomal protein S18 acetylase RimI-like enzyme